MQITVAGKGVDVGESLRSHIEARLEEGVKKYLDRVTSVSVVISKESHMFRVDISGNTGTHSGLVIRSQGRGDDVYACFDAAADKIEKQLRRYKRRLTNHQKHRMSDEDIAVARSQKAVKYVLAPEGDEANEKLDHVPVIVAEKPTDIETLTVSEAVMKMDLADLPALLFFNSAHGRVNVVYRRADGNISWVDPGEKAA